MLNRRAALLSIACGGLGILPAACHNGSEQGESELIREWFRSVHYVEVTDDEIRDIREYIRRPSMETDPMVQPAILFNPEVDLA